MVSPKAGADPVSDIIKLPFVKKGRKDIAAYMKNHQQPLGILKINEVAKVRKIQKPLKQSFDAALFTTNILPKNADWADMVCQPQLFGTSSCFLHVGFAHFASMECCLLFEGTETIVGIPLEAVPGSSVKEKRKHLYMSTVDTVRGMVERDGFVVNHDYSSLLVVPTGYLLIVASTGAVGAVGLRWSISSDDADSERVKMSLSNLLSSFPEMKNPSTGLGQWLAYLDSE